MAVGIAERTTAAGAVAALAAAVDEVLGAVSGAMARSLDGPQARELLGEVVRQSRRLEAAQVSLVSASVAADTALLGDAGQARARVVAALRTERVRPSAATGLLDAAEALDAVDGALREVGPALAAGETSLEHLAVAVSALEKVPGRLRRQFRAEVAGAVLDAVTTWAPADVKQVTGRVLDWLAPTASERFDPDAFERRSFHVATDSTGMVVTSGQHDPAQGAFMKVVLGELSKRERPVPCSDGAVDAAEAADPGGPGPATVGVLDTRSAAMRRHDALHELVRAGAEALATSDTSGRLAAAMARITVVTGPEVLSADPPAGADEVAGVEAAVDAVTTDAGSALPEPATIAGHGTAARGLLQLLACDAVLDHLVRAGTGRVVSLVTRGRLATPGIVRALVARDGGCAVPGCARPPGVCDAHHVVWWSHGGPTHVDNLVLLCAHHHAAVHAGRWEVSMRGGVPWFRPPDSPDWTRNTFTDALRRADRLGARMRRALDDHHRTPRPPPRWPAAGT